MIKFNFFDHNYYLINEAGNIRLIILEKLQATFASKTTSTLVTTYLYACIVKEYSSGFSSIQEVRSDTGRWPWYTLSTSLHVFSEIITLSLSEKIKLSLNM